nr:hypothetical protein BaRGS_009229 [Batillaria attramentaria]
MTENVKWTVRGQYRYRYFHSQFEEDLSQYNVTSGCGEEAQPEVQVVVVVVIIITTTTTIIIIIIVVVVVVVIIIININSIMEICLAPNLLLELWAYIFHLHYGYNLIGVFLWSVSGGTVGMYFASFALASDTHGFFYTLMTVLGCKIVLFSFAYVFVTETGQQKKNIGAIRRAAKDPQKRITFILVIVGLLFTLFSFVDEYDVLRTYQMSPPFCFTAVQLGWFNGESYLKSALAIPLMFVWRRLRLLESTVAMIGMLFAVTA